MFINREKDREIVVATKEGLRAAIKRKNLISRRMINLMKNKKNLLTLLLCFTLLITTTSCGVSSTVLKKDKKWWSNITEIENITDISNPDDFSSFFKNTSNKNSIFALKNIEYKGMFEDTVDHYGFGTGAEIHVFKYQLNDNDIGLYGIINENNSVYMKNEKLDIVAIYRDFSYESDSDGSMVMIGIEIIGIQEASDKK